jgi:ATP-dependent 26S proteasome regulatory subunit
MAARVLSRKWNVPLFRLDLAATMNRWLGESERRISRHLQQVENEAPCILLFDEEEKLFGKSDDSTMGRILGTLLWWLAEHKSKVIVLQTTNRLADIPPELYRPGRADKVINLPLLLPEQAKKFAVRVYESVLELKIPASRQAELFAVLEKTGGESLPHALVAELVYETIKRKNWISGQKQIILDK